MERQLDYVLRTVEERGVRFVRLWFTDVLGSLKSFAITPAELEAALEEGMTFDGSAIEGYSRVQESDMLAVPDPNTFEIVPWRGDDAPVARMFCDIQHLSGEPFEGDPRYVLKRNLDRAREKGFTFYAGPEMEFFYFESDDEPEPLDHAGFFDLTQHRHGERAAQAQTILTLEAMGIPVEYSLPRERPEPARDRPALHRRAHDGRQRDDVPARSSSRSRRTSACTRRSCRSRSPARSARACTRTCRCSRATSTRSTTRATSTACRRSASASSPACCATRSEITAVTNQTVNSYKRLIEGYEAPTYICWARNNESALVRVPLAEEGQGELAPASSSARPTRRATRTSRSR